MLGKKKKLDKAKQGRETNFLLSKNVKVSYDTRKTKLGVMNCLTIGQSGCGKTFTHLKPNIYSLPTLNGKPCSMVITDPKGGAKR